MNWRTCGSVDWFELLGLAVRHHDAAGHHQVGVVGDREAFLHVVRDHQRRGAGGVVEAADQVGGDAHRDRIEAGEGLVVHDDLGVERDRARERDAARHAARDLGDAQLRRAAQAHRVELHQHDVADHGLAQVHVLAQREGDVLVDAQVGEQRAELEQHAQAAADRVELRRGCGCRPPRRRTSRGPSAAGRRRRSGAAASSCRNPSRREWP